MFKSIQIEIYFILQTFEKFSIPTFYNSKSSWKYQQNAKSKQIFTSTNTSKTNNRP